MTKIINSEDLLKHDFTKCVFDAFSHLDFVKQVKSLNDPSLLLNGYSLADFSASDMSFEEYFVRNLFKKVGNVVVPGVDPELNTINKFTAFLDAQERDNIKVTHILNTIDNSTSVGRVLLRARSIFHEVFSGFREGVLEPRFTSGSSISLSKREGTSPFSRYKVSEGSKHLQNIYLKRRQEGISRVSFLDISFPQTEGTDDFYVLIELVPKLWDIHRVIGKGPTSITAVQAGLGDWFTYIAKSRIGIDITTAQPKHKNLARMASLIDSYLMTLDQSEASDRILRVLVKWLMPPDVFMYMEDISPSVLEMPDGTFRGTHMMAPAGNGYIFPLQTILFHTLAKSVCIEMSVKPEVYSYGDDLIAPAAIYTQLQQVFEVLTLKVNPNKTFRSGTARESCGGDYVLGSDVRPLYVNNIPSTITEWYSVINGIRRVGCDNNSGYWRTNNFRRLWLWCIKNLRPKHRICAPIHYGDTAIGTPDERLYRLSYKRTYVCGSQSKGYPFGGLRKGIPYSGWYITINATKSTGKGLTFPQHTQGIKTRDLMRLLPLGSVKGSGDELMWIKRDANGKKLNSPVAKYVFKPFFHKDEYSNHQIEVPLTLECPAPNENMDDLFSCLSEDNPIRDTQAVVQRMEMRYQHCLVSLLDTLKARLSYMEGIARETEDLELNF